MAGNKKIKGVKKAYRVSGYYDIIAEVEGKDHESAGKVVLKIRGIHGVSSISTAAVLDN